MDGPFALGTNAPILHPSKWDWEKDMMRRGQVYRVIAPFVDADGDQHPVGEEWIFVGTLFCRQSDKLTLVLRTAKDEEWTLPLIWKPEAQETTIEHFGRIVAPVGCGLKGGD